MNATATKSNAHAGPSSAAKKKSQSLPPETVEYLKAWMMSPEHVAHPYPTEQEKAQIMAETGIELKQLTNWFVNNRKRYWKPRVEAKLQKFGGAPGKAAGLNGGGLSISVHHVNQPKAGATLFPPQASNAAALFAQAGGPASPHEHAAAYPPRPHVVPLLDDQHIVSSSSSSSSSACSSGDEESLTDPSSRRGSLKGANFALPPPAGAHPIPSIGLPLAAAPVVNGYKRHEEVDVHVLRPLDTPEGTEPLPTLRDLTIKPNVPQERILATFRCPISYVIPYEIEGDKKKVQSKRDGEVLRVKKHYLRLYLATRGIHSASSPVGSKDAEAAAVASPEASAAQAITPLAQGSRTRSITDADQQESPRPRKRARSADGTYLTGEAAWRALCQEARSVHCETLPGLEEAARMFGYVS